VNHGDLAVSDHDASGGIPLKNLRACAVIFFVYFKQQSHMPSPHAIGLIDLSIHYAGRNNNEESPFALRTEELSLMENDCDSNKTGVIVKFRNAWILFATVEIFYRIKEVSILHRII
jgi:hypothetical protein